MSITMEHVKIIRKGIMKGGDYLLIASDHVDTVHTMYSTIFKPHLNAYNELTFSFVFQSIRTFISTLNINKIKLMIRYFMIDFFFLVASIC